MTLEGDDWERVAAANILYDFTSRVMDLCASLGKPCVVENPRNSLFWAVTPWVDRVHVDQDVVQDHQACGYGSISGQDWFQTLNRYRQ